MFQPLLSLKKLKRPDLLGIDLGSQCVKIVKMGRRPNDKLAVEFCGLYPIPRSSPDFESDLHGAVKEAGLAGLSAAVCLDDTSLKTRKMELPAMPDADLKEAVRWNMREAVEGPVADYSIASSLIEETTAGGKVRQTLLGYAVKKKSVIDLMNLATRIGLKPSAIEPSAVSLASAVDRAWPSDDLWIAGIDLGAEKVVLTILGRGRFYFTRLLPGLRSSDAKENGPEFMKKLAGEIQNSLDAFSVAFHQETIHRISLSGGGAGIGELPEYLAKNLAIQTSRLDPFAGMEMSDQAKKTVADKGYLFSQAVSLAWMNG
ncbi:MAG: pilus assembly protein PilM [Deltaproteobacteria bacterium]|nr:pilus assembly protein PilM [Deltaproteobacteria bacterium]